MRKGFFDFDLWGYIDRKDTSIYYEYIMMDKVQQSLSVVIHNLQHVLCSRVTNRAYISMAIAI